VPELLPTVTPTLNAGRDNDASQMLRGRDILCFSHDWTGDPLSKTHLMRLLARENRILWVNSIGYRAPTVSRGDVRRIFQKLAAATKPIEEVEPNIFVLNPLAIPAYGRASIRTLNRVWLRSQVRRAMKRLQFRRAINWVFNPAAAIIAGQLGEANIIYYCVDEYSAISGVAREPFEAMERDLLSRADLVVVSSDKLYDSKSPHNPHTVLVRHGVQFDHFRRALDDATEIPEDVKNLPRPILGYFGLMTEDWVDRPLLEHLARTMPEASLVLLGKVAMDLSPLRGLPNVHILGRKPFESLPAYCKAFDVGLIPFPITELTLNSNPLKAREYVAAGLPVVSTRIPEVEAVPGCRIADDMESFVKEVEAALTDGGPLAARSDLMRDEDWERKLADVCRSFNECCGSR